PALDQHVPLVRAPRRRRRLHRVRVLRRGDAGVVRAVDGRRPDPASDDGLRREAGAGRGLPPAAGRGVEPAPIRVWDRIRTRRTGPGDAAVRGSVRERALEGVPARGGRVMRAYRPPRVYRHARWRLGRARRYLGGADAFLQPVLTLVGGAAAAQALVFATRPVLTRLFTPDDFGVLTVFVTLVAVLGTVASGRYEDALMLPEDDGEAAHVLSLALLV